MDRQKKLLMVGNAMLLCVLAFGCDAVDDPGAVDGGAEEATLRPGSGAGGVWLNTNAIGTTPISELDLQGKLHDGARLGKVSVKASNGAYLALDKIEWVGGQPRGRRGNTHYSGASMVGSKWELTLVVDGAPQPKLLTIADYEEAAPGEYRYVFQYNDADGAPQDVCAPDVSGDVSVIPLKDISVDDATGAITQRSNTLYLACTSGAVGKAVVWGYKPWERSLAEFAAAVRMVRADYCYDGRSWTTPGTPVEVRDRWHINDFLNEDHPTEALWGEDGLVCLSTARSFSYPEITCASPLPSCDGETLDDTNALYWVKNDPQ